MRTPRLRRYHQLQPFPPNRSRRRFPRHLRLPSPRCQRSRRSPRSLRFPGLQRLRHHRHFLRNRRPHCRLGPDLAARPLRRRSPRLLDRHRPANLRPPESPLWSPLLRKRHHCRRQRRPLALRGRSSRQPPRPWPCRSRCRTPKERPQRAATTAPSRPTPITIVGPASERQGEATPITASTGGTATTSGSWRAASPATTSRSPRPLTR